MTVTDAWKAYKYHLPYQHSDTDLSMVGFADALALEMLHNNYSAILESDIAPNLPLLKGWLVAGDDSSSLALTDFSPLTGHSTAVQTSTPWRTTIEREVHRHRAIKRPTTVHDDHKSK